MRIALTVLGNGRLDYLHQSVDAALQHLPPFDYYLMVDDSGDRTVRRELTRTYPDFRHISHGRNMGMAFSVNDVFAHALDTNADYIFHVEEDMLLTAPPPIEEAIRELELNPRLAQMCFRREAIDPSEGDDQLAAICNQATRTWDGGQWTAHNFIFSLNPCLIPRRILEYGWPAGPLGIGNETGMTNRLLEDGWWFASWGRPDDGQTWGRHIGYASRAPHWQL